jgi:hypothetical protein
MEPIIYTTIVQNCNTNTLYFILDKNNKNPDLEA